MKIFVKILSIFLGLVLCYSFIGCGKEKKVESNFYTIELETTFNGEELSTVCSEVKEYLNATTEEKQIECLLTYSDAPFLRDNIMFEWSDDGSKIYTVHFSEDENFTNEITVETRKQYCFDSCLFVPGKKYYWKVTGDTVSSSSATDSFVYSDQPVRVIDFEGGQNVRDMGGWKTTDGKRVKFNKIIRGGRINNIGEAGIDVLKNQLKIRTEIDLRGSHDDGGQNSCIFDKNANYVKVNLNQYCYILPQFNQITPIKRSYDSETPQKIKKIFDVLKDENNYPVYMHCNAGADRTGTLAFLINGVAGVPYEDLLRDFELTSFTHSGRRWRGDIDRDSKELISDVMQDDKGNYVAFEKMYNIMRYYYGGENISLRENIENYLTSVCGVTIEDINMIRSILLEEV